MLGNVSAEDTHYFVQEFRERYGKTDLLQLPNYRIDVKLRSMACQAGPLAREDCKTTRLVGSRNNGLTQAR